MSNRLRKHAKRHESGGLDPLDLENLAGIIADIQATQFLLLTGERKMTGDLDWSVDDKRIYLPKGANDTYPAEQRGSLIRTTEYDAGHGVPDRMLFCGADANGIFTWQSFSAKWADFTLLKDYTGITMKNIGTSYVDVLPLSLMNHVDLGLYGTCRVIWGGYNSDNNTIDLKLQYSTAGITWIDLTTVGSITGTAEQLVISAYGTIPSGAKVGCYIKAIAKSNEATDDPVFQNIILQVRRL